jgi:hypothetical protein
MDTGYNEKSIADKYLTCQFENMSILILTQLAQSNFYCKDGLRR